MSDSRGNPVNEQRRTILIPLRARQLILTALQEKQRVERELSLILAATRESLDVPSDWVLTDLDEGFVPAPAREE